MCFLSFEIACGVVCKCLQLPGVTKHMKLCILCAMRTKGCAKHQHRLWWRRASTWPIMASKFGVRRPVEKSSNRLAASGDWPSEMHSDKTLLHRNEHGVDSSPGINIYQHLNIINHESILLAKSQEFRASIWKAAIWQECSNVEFPAVASCLGRHPVHHFKRWLPNSGSNS